MQERWTSPPAIVALTAAHLDAVTAIESRVTAAGWSRQIFERELVADRSRCYLVAQRSRVAGTQVLGYCGMQLLTDEAHITNVAVDIAYRRRGVATRLLIELLREARARGAASATLEVRTDNIAAQRLYARLGFRPVGTRPKYYDAATDALIMWAHDVGGADFGRLLRERDPVTVTVAADHAEARCSRPPEVAPGPLGTRRACHPSAVRSRAERGD
jgi:ribosomal-protein-alanine N-acetyltransferase